MNAKSPVAVPGGATANVESIPLAFTVMARTMASRHRSVRASAQEFQMPDAQFSVSKNQLIPHTGTVAAITAAMGRPFTRPLPSATGTEKRASRRRIPTRSR